MNKTLNKKILITGANSGIGKATVLGLARQGAEIIMVCRNSAKAESARENIIKQTNNQNIDILIADLAEQQQVRALAQQIIDRYDTLDVLIHNAGIFNTKRQETIDGVESQLALHLLAPMLLSYLLLDKLITSAPARIINITSMLHIFGRINLNDLQQQQKYNGLKAYGSSKLANIMFTRYLAKHLQDTGVTVNCLHPGVINTNLGGTPELLKPLLSSPEKGAKTPIYLATSPEVETTTGEYFVNCKVKKPSRACHDWGLIDALMQRSEQLIHEPLAPQLKKVV